MSINDVKNLEKTIPKLSKAYFNGEPLVSDHVFDTLVYRLKKLKPDSQVLKKIGAPVRDDKKKVKLPYWMGGMDKMKPESNEMRIYFTKNQGPYFLSDKIDGAALLLEYIDGNLKGIYSRGEGNIGQDLNFLRGFLKVPLKIKLKDKLFIKGELNLTKKEYLENFSEEATKARGVVTGVFNSLEPNLEIVQSLVFSAYEINYKNREDLIIKPSDSYKLMKALGFKTPYSKLYEGKDLDKKLSEYLKTRKEKSLFEIDGIIVAQDSPYKELKKDNPKHAIAFKVNEEPVNTRVLDITWEPTKHGVLFPVMIIEPVILEGDNVKHVSGKNANFMIENGIGIGSQIGVVKSGGVIPEIIEVIKKAKISLPKVKFKWDINHVNIVLEKPLDNLLVRMKRTLHFFTSVGVKAFKIGTIKKLYNINLDSIDKICKAGVEDFIKADGIKIKSAQKLYDNIHNIIEDNIPLEKLMFASLTFDKGMGSKRFKIILDNLPKIYKLERPTTEEILKIEGFGEIVSEQFLEGFSPFKNFIKKHNFLKFKPPELESNVGRYTGEIIVFSGFRDKFLKEKLEKNGAKVEDNLTNKTTLLVVKNKEENSGKIKKAREKNIKIIEIGEL